MSDIIAPYELSPHIAPLEVCHGHVQYRHGTVPRTKVAIFGGHGWRDAPWNDPEWEVWSLNNFWGSRPDATGCMPSRDRLNRLAASRWWEFHQITPDHNGPEAGTPIQDEYDLQWIATCPVPIYVVEPVPINPRAVVWPLSYFNHKYRNYFTCTFAAQIITAFDEGFQEIAVYGLELLLGTKRECTVEAACVNYWLGYVEGRGMKVTIPDGDFVLKHPHVYGVDYWPERRWVEQYIRRWDHLPEAI